MTFTDLNEQTLSGANSVKEKQAYSVMVVIWVRMSSICSCV